MALTTTRKVSAFVLVLKNIHSRNQGESLLSLEGSQDSLGKGWPEDCHSERSEESRSVPQASLGKEWLEGRKIDSLTHWTINSLAHFTCGCLVFAMIQ
jgi:hypothetical protein